MGTVGVDAVAVAGRVGEVVDADAVAVAAAKAGCVGEIVAGEEGFVQEGRAKAIKMATIRIPVARWLFIHNVILVSPHGDIG